MYLFGRKKKNNPVEPRKAIQTLKDTLATMEKREEYLEKQISNFINQAIKAKKNNRKHRALHFLKKKKLVEKQLTTCFNTKMTLETQIDALIQAVNNTATVNAISQGRNALKTMESKINPNEVSDVVDDLEEQLSMVDEVSDAISRPIGDVYDDDDLLAELDGEIFDEQVQKQSIPVSITNKKEMPKEMPKVPTNKPNKLSFTGKENQELRKLKKLMNM